jgi:urease subunit alpha
MFGAHGNARAATNVTFLSAAGMATVAAGGLPGLRRRLEPVRDTRGLSKSDLPRNDALPVMEVDSDSYNVRADGELLVCEPLAVAPLAQRYFMF